METSVERKAQNEGTFRKANEKLERRARELVGAEGHSPVPFLCECPEQGCMQVLLLTLREYEQVRSRGELGLAAPGHDDASIERVVAKTDRFVITEKLGPATDVHAGADPR